MIPNHTTPAGISLGTEIAEWARANAAALGVTYVIWREHLWFTLTATDGTVFYYAHQTTTAVTLGQRVSAGQIIGKVGATGNVTGPHLHLEVRIGGVPTDPERWLRTQGLTP